MNEICRIINFGIHSTYSCITRAYCIRRESFTEHQHLGHVLQMILECGHYIVRRSTSSRYEDDTKLLDSVTVVYTPHNQAPTTTLHIYTGRRFCKYSTAIETKWLALFYRPLPTNSRPPPEFRCSGWLLEEKRSSDHPSDDLIMLFDLWQQR